MFGRKRRDDSDRHQQPPIETIGIGAIVAVIDSPDSGWQGEPTGVVISPGDNEMAGYPGLAPGGPVSWLVAFAEPAYRVSSDAPFDEATVAARFLKLVPADDPATGE